jgi:hypothetical protein
MLRGGDTMRRGVGRIGVPKKKNGSILAVHDGNIAIKAVHVMTWKDQGRLNLLEKKGEEP